MRHTSFTFSVTELSQLFRAWFAIALAFGILLNGGFALTPKFFFLVVVAAFTVGLGFLLHELAHKAVAVRYGCWAEFRSFDSMLVLAVLMSFFGFILAAPGAVFIQGRVSVSRNGLISAVGPLTNLFLGIVFLLLSFVLSGSLGIIAFYGLMINSWLAIFNLLPILGLDGTKVFRWNKLVYFSMLVFAFGMLGLSYFLNNNV
ncbi:hypothetical protein HYY74_05850 [Candidatus Woesearchaeota archaeon]|nr:hypothetical protein [Candidatus Woesearchaeota archaeon]